LRNYVFVCFKWGAVIIVPRLSDIANRKDMEEKIKYHKLKIALGFFVLPFAYCLFVIDRMIAVLMPMHPHPNFSDWLSNKNVRWAVVRLLTVAFLRLLSYWSFGV